MSTVSLARCPGYEPEGVAEALDRALEALGGLGSFVRAGDQVLLKPNLVSGAPPEAAATTHPQIVDALLSRLADLGARTSLGDSPAFDTASGVCRKAGLKKVLRRYNVPIVELTAPVPVESPCPRVARRFMVDRLVQEADVLINLPKLKSHRQLGFTAAVKNLYGCMPGKRKAFYHFSRGNRDMDFARIIAAFAYTVKPELSIVDAVVAMERDGPTGGDPRPLGFIAAGADPAAVDTVLEAIIRPDPEISLVVNACRELGLGATQMDKIQVLGPSPGELAVSDFRHPLLIGVRFSPARLVRSIWRNLLITRFNYDPR